MTIYSLDVLLSLFGTSLLFHVLFYLLLLDLYTDFSRGRSGGLILPSLKEFSRVCRATQDRRVMVESSDKTWSTGEGNGKPLQYLLYVLKESFGLSPWEVTEGNQDQNGDQVGGCSNNASERWGWLEQGGSSRHGEKRMILEISESKGK